MNIQYLYVITTLIIIGFFFFYPKFNQTTVKYLCFHGCLILFFNTTMAWLLFNPFESLFQMNIALISFQFSMYFGIDGISLLFIFLTTFLFPICMLYNWESVNNIQSNHYCIIFSMELILIGIFITQNALYFYICFEAVLIPMFILIGINNYRARRIHAAYMLFLYTTFGSLFTLISLIIIYSNTGTFNFYTLYSCKINEDISLILWLFLFFSLSVKIPLFPFHIWLPEAHVEAPTEGSIILAGVLLKLGFYGYIRILIPIFYETTLYYMPLIYSISLVSGIYASLVTLRQIDMKKIIAYSSVAHMSIGILGLFTLNPIGIVGSTILMFSHGVVSGGLFLIIGILYDRFKTKTLFYMNGLIQFMPLAGTFMFILILANISFPGTSNFIGETLCLLGITKLYKGVLIFIAPTLFLCTLYSLLLYNRIFFGIPSLYKINYVFDLTRREINSIIPIVLMISWVGVYPNSFFKLVESPIYFITFLQ